MNGLVTGAGGFIGSVLVESLLARGSKVHAVCRRPSRFLPKADDRLVVHPGDVTDAAFLRNVIGQIRPDLIYHLAAQSLPEVSWKKPAETFQINVLGTHNLLESVRAAGLDALTICVCSSSEYAPSRTDAPIAEDGRLDPSSLYAVSKLAQDQTAQLYAQKYSLRVIRARPFFLVGPRKTGDVCSDFARHIAAIEQGREKEVPVGNLEVVRDILDVRDGVAGLLRLADHGQPGQVYNVCSGQGYAVGALLDIMKSFSKAAIHARPDPALQRPIDEMVKIGDPTRLKQLGWSPEFKIEDTLKGILEYWRNEGRKG